MKQTYHFSKYHGLGNDFIIFDGINQRIDLDFIQKNASQICDRNFGIGGDGIMVVLASEDCDLAMKIYNADGTSPEMCGNGLRCFARFCYDHKLIETDVFSVQTDAGKMIPALIIKDGDVVAIEIDMGMPQYDLKLMPDNSLIYPQSLMLFGNNCEGHFVSMGNPHLVVFVADIEDSSEGYLVTLKDKKSYLFKDIIVELYKQSGIESVNVEFVKIIDKNHCKMIVHERGVGETLACGTGACAVVVAGSFCNQLARKVTVDQPGGSVVIEWQDSDNHVIKTGPVTPVFEGHFML